MFYIKLAIFIILVLKIESIKQGQYEVVPMSGVYFEEQDVDLYDSVGTIVFNLPKPDWLNQFPFFLGYPCNSDKYSEATLCPIFFYISKQLTQQLEAAMEVNSANMPLTDMEIKFDCDEVSKHFPTFRLLGERMEEYLDRLSKCGNNRMIKESLVNTGEGKFRTIYDKMVHRFMEEFHNYLPTSNRENKASELNHRLAMTSIIVTHLLALKDQWSNAISECKSGFIPESLVTPYKLRSQLEKLEKQLEGAAADSKMNEGLNYKFTLPHTGPQISRYYKAPVADCVMTEDKLYIRVLVPITLKRVTPSTLIKIKSVPFHTQTDEHQLCVINGFEKGRYFNLGVERAGSVVISQAMEVNCDTSNFHLCKIPASMDNIVDTVTDCARAIITNEFESSEENKMNLVAACKLECNRVDTNKFPIIVRTRTSLGTVYVMMNPDNNEDLFMECEKKDDSYAIKPPVNGVIGITIPCKCKLILKAKTLHPDPATCKDYFIANAIPYHWAGQNLLAK